jgi:predicted amidohydrolase
MSRYEILPGDRSRDACPDGHVRVAAVQMEPKIGAVRENTGAVIEALDLACDQGARLAVFPECTLTGYCFDSADEAREAAVERDSPWIRDLAAAAAARDAAIVVGYMERTGSGIANALSILGEGGVLGHYRKTHLPHLGGDRFVDPGRNRFTVHTVFGLRLGLLICYDASFPEASRLLALAGADLLCLPTNWPKEALSKAAWLPNTRAYENVVYFASVNRVGTERGFDFHGLSRICDPTGETMVEGPRDRPAVLLADVDPARARTKKITRREGYWVDRIGQRRPDLYTLSGNGGEDSG